MSFNIKSDTTHAVIESHFNSVLTIRALLQHEQKKTVLNVH